MLCVVQTAEWLAMLCCHQGLHALVGWCLLLLLLLLPSCQ
jgi:hypothetical protein